MLDTTDKDAFWSVVEECLVEIHGFTPHNAHKRSKELRRRNESPPAGISGDILYHDEPFYVACDIAGNQLDLSKYGSKYEPILERHKW